MVDSSAARMEDPVEDVFVGCVNSSYGRFRIMAGVFSDGDFWTERLLAFLAEKQDFPPFQKALEGALPLLKISDAIAERASLSRYAAGKDAGGGKIHLPNWRTIVQLGKAVQFSKSELARLGIGCHALRDFVLSSERRARLPKEELWNSSLERCPLLDVPDGILVAAPSSLQRAVIRHLLEHITKGMGGWADTFFQTEVASMFVNDVRNRLEIKSLDFKAPPWPEGLPPMFPFFGYFDYGKPVVMLTHCLPLSQSARDFNGIDDSVAAAEGKLEEFLRACTQEFEKAAGFSGGLVLINLAGVGLSTAFGFREVRPGWHIHAATLPDWLTITASGDCTAMRLWKLGEHQAVLDGYGIKVVNLSGLVNLYGFWKSNGFRLVPRTVDPRHLSLLSLVSDFGTGLRVETKQRRDVHCLPSHDGKCWRTITKRSAYPLFKEDASVPVYADYDSSKQGLLVGCVRRQRTNWWVIAPPRGERPELSSLVFQLWECIEAWVASIAMLVERDWPGFSPPSIEIQLNLPNLAKWDRSHPNTQPGQAEAISVSVIPSQSQITLTIPETFLQKFSTPKNVAEREIVAAVLKASSQLAGNELSDQQCADLTRQIMGSEDARRFHVVAARGLEQMIAGVAAPNPLFIQEEDLGLARQGLADLVGRPKDAKEVLGIDACREYLKDAVTKVWERIELRLKHFDRASVVLRCFRALNEVARDEEHWEMSARALLALHQDKENVFEVLNDRQSDRAKASLCNRLIIETVQYACPPAGGRIFTEADHLTLLADLEILILLANHRDAIAYGFMDPRIGIFPNGELEVDEKFYSTVMSQYLTRRARVASESAASNYESFFPWLNQQQREKKQGDDNALSEFDRVFAPEFGFSIRLLFTLLDELRTMAVKTEVPGGEVTEDMMQSLLRVSGFRPPDGEAFLRRFTLPIRGAWDADLPPGCRVYDVFPWRFRRQLSLNVRPLVQLSASPRAWLLSVPTFEKSVNYLLGHLERARFPKDHFHSPEMQAYVGNVTNKRGHDFAESVMKIFVESGHEAALEIEVARLGAPKKLGLGDVDVLAWEESSGRVYAVECKRLLAANSVREVVQRLEDFRGDKKELDSLARHLRRIEWLNQSPGALAKCTGILSERLRLIPLLVTSELMPMQFYEGMNFPTSHVLPVGELVKALAKANRGN
jgi:hypothetical protein